MKQVTQILRTNVKKFRRPDYLASMICASFLYIMEDYCTLVVQVANWDHRTAQCLTDHDTNKTLYACDTGSSVLSARPHSPVYTLESPH